MSATTVAPQIAKIQAAVAASQKTAAADLSAVGAKIAEHGVRFAESHGREVMRLTGFLSGLKEIEWALAEEADRDRPLPLAVANLLLDLSGMQAATAEGVNLPQRSPDFIGGKVSAVRSVSRMLVDSLHDASE